MDSLSMVGISMNGTSSNLNTEANSLKRKLSLEECHVVKQRRKWIPFPLDDPDVLRKVYSIIDLIEKCYFAVPFLTTNKHEYITRKPESIEEIKRRLRDNVYINTEEVFEDLDNLFNIELKKDDKEITIPYEHVQRQIKAKTEELEIMGKEMRRNLRIWFEIFSDTNVQENSVENKIHKALVKRFSNIPSKDLMIQAYDISKTSEENLKNILRKLHEKNENQRPDLIFQKFRLSPSQLEDLDQDKLLHFYIAAHQFHKMMGKWMEPNCQIPIPLRTVSNISDAIDYIDYIKNPKLEKEYETQLNKFQMEKKNVKETLLFHGTAVSCVESILKTNFIIDHDPVPESGQTLMRGKKMMFGRGVYFSSLPSASLMYGNGLILCKVLLGDCEQYKPIPGQTQPEINDQFDSREILTRDNTGVIHVVKNTSQILPYCVIHLRKDAISKEYRTPYVAPATKSNATSLSTSTPHPPSCPQSKSTPQAPCRPSISASLPTSSLHLPVAIMEAAFSFSLLPILAVSYIASVRTINNHLGAPWCLQR